MEVFLDRTYLDKWDHRFMDMARLVATWSKDASRQVGCVIVSPDRSVRAVGYNGFPRGVQDQGHGAEERNARPAKYLWTEHAERNAIYNAARNQTSLIGCTMYLPWFPCADCARGIIQVGISHLVCGQKPDLNDPQWGEGFRVVEAMLLEGRVKLLFL